MQGKHATLVIIEYGALWPRWLNPNRLGDIAVIAQHYEGPPHSLVTQVENRLTRLVVGQWLIESAILVSNGRTDLESLGARSIVARGVLSHLKKDGGQRLVLAVSPERGERACKTLAALVDTLQRGARESGIELTLATTETSPSHHPRAKLSSDIDGMDGTDGIDGIDAGLFEAPELGPSKVPLLAIGALAVC
jgi:hypothetical protein